MSNDHADCRIQKRSTSEEQLLEFIEKNPNFEGKVQLQPTQSSFGDIGFQNSTLTSMQHDRKLFQDLQCTCISQEDYIHSSQRSSHPEKSLSSLRTNRFNKEDEAERKYGIRSSWYKNTSFSFSCGEAANDSASNIKNQKSDPFHLKLQRYKTFHGSSRREQHRFHKQLLHQHLQLKVDHIPCCAPFMVLFIAKLIICFKEPVFVIFISHLLNVLGPVLPLLQMKCYIDVHTTHSSIFKSTYT